MDSGEHTQVDCPKDQVPSKNRPSDLFAITLDIRHCF